MRRRKTIQKRAGWVRMTPPGDKLGCAWQHVATKWELVHCGHPTANWPYYLIDPARQGRQVMSHNGLGWGTLHAGMVACEGIIAGRIKTTEYNCGRHTIRALIQADGMTPIDYECPIVPAPGEQLALALFPEDGCSAVHEIRI